MKRLFTIVLLLALTFSLTAQGKPIITVLDFTVGGISVQEMRAVIGYLSNALFKTGKYQVIDVTKRDTLLKEMEFSVSGCTDEACQLKIGKMLTAAAIVVGDITKFGTRYILTARMIETESANTINIADGKYASLDEIVDDLDAFGRRLAGTVDASEAATSKPSGGAETASPKLTSPATQPNVPDGFVLVEGGILQRGGRSVVIGTFGIGKHEVTQALYRQVMGANPSDFTGDANRPVESVSWFDAVTFCNALSRKDNREPCYKINGQEVSCDFARNGYRLPTEAEWEYAAQGGVQSNGYTYAGSNDVDAVAWFAGNSGGKPHPVGTKRANELGLYDMTGNVWEWCWDWWGEYPEGRQTDPRGPLSGSFRVLRGQHWKSTELRTLSTSVRGYIAPTISHNYIGFRIAVGGLFAVKIGGDTPRVYKVGDQGPAGGIVFHDKGTFSDGWRYLEAASTDTSTGIPWWNGTAKMITTDRAIGSGKDNTTAIVAAQGTGSYAAKLSHDLVLGGFDDWFLPSSDELNLMFINLKKAGLGEFSSTWYWSSSQSNGSSAWGQQFSYGDRHGSSTGTSGCARAIRAF